MTTCPHGYVSGPGGGCFHEIGLSGVTLEGEDPCPEHGPGLSCGCMGRSFGGVRVWDGGAGRAAALNVAAAYAFEHRPNGPYNDDWDPNRTPYGMGPGYPVPETVMIPSGDLPGWSGCETDLDRLRHPAINPAWLGDPFVELVAFPCQPVELYIGPQDVIVGPTGGAWPADFATYKPGETLPHKFWQAKAIGQQAWDVVPAPGVEIAQIFGAYALYASGSIRHFVTGKCGPKGGGGKLPPRGHGFPGHGSGSGVRGIGLGTVYDPSDIAHVIGTLLGGNQIIAPPPPTWASGQDWAGMLKNAGAAIYSALNPGAGPPPPDNAIGTLQAYVTAAANMLKLYGPGGGATLPGTIPAIPGIPAIDHLNPMLMGLPAYLGGILPGLLTLPGVIPIPPVPTGIDPASYLAAVSNLATTLFGTMFPGRTALPTIPEAFDFLKAAGIMLQHYLPGAPPATVDPPLAPPKVIDCGLPGWFFDDGQGQCVPIPGYPPPPHIGPTGCTVPGTVVQADGSCAPNPTTPAPPAVTKVQCADGTTVDDIAKCPKPKAAGGGGGGGSNTAMYVLGGLGVLALIGVAAAAAANPAPAGKKK